MKSAIVAEKFKDNALLGAALVFLGAIMFSTKAVFVKLAYREQIQVDAISLLTLRMVFALPVYLVINLFLHWKHKPHRLSVKIYGKIIMLGAVGYYLASYFDFYGLKFISASLERLILFVYPTLVVIIASIVYKSKITKVQVFSILLTYAGIFIIFYNDLQVGQQEGLIKGGLLIFISALTYAIYLVGSQGLIQQTGAIRFTTLAMTVSAICVMTHFVVTNDIAYLFRLPAKIYWISILIALVATVFPSFLISKGISLIGSSNASIISGIGPVSTLVLAYLFLDERIPFIQGVGTLVVIMAVIFISLSRQSKSEKT